MWKMPPHRAAKDVEDGLCGLVRVLATVTVGVLRSVVVVLLVVVDVDVVVVVGLAVVVTGTIVSMFLSSCWNSVKCIECSSYASFIHSTQQNKFIEQNRLDECLHRHFTRLRPNINGAMLRILGIF